MPKVKPVNNDEVVALVEAAQSVAQDAHEVVRRMNSAAELEEPINAASAILAVSRALADLAAALLMQAKLAEQKAVLEKMMRERLKEEMRSEKKK